MSSIDYVFDLSDKLEENGCQYVLATLRPGEKIDKIDVFYWIPDDIARKELATVLRRISDDLLTKTDDEIEKERTIGPEDYEANDESDEDFFEDDEKN